MGLLDFLFQKRRTNLAPIPKGSFTVDREGRIMTSTLSGAFPQDHLNELGHRVLTIFRNAKNTDSPLTELLVHYSALKLHAREMRGGAIVFLTPLTLNQGSNHQHKNG